MVASPPCTAECNSLTSFGLKGHASLPPEVDSIPLGPRAHGPVRERRKKVHLPALQTGAGLSTARSGLCDSGFDIADIEHLHQG